MDLGRNLDLLRSDICHLVLDLLDLVDGFVDVGLLPGDCYHVTVGAAIWKVNLGVGLVADPLDVGSTLANDKFMELLEDRDLDLVTALLHLLDDEGLVLGLVPDVAVAASRPVKGCEVNRCGSTNLRIKRTQPCTHVPGASDTTHNK